MLTPLSEDFWLLSVPQNNCAAWEDEVATAEAWARSLVMVP